MHGCCLRALSGCDGHWALLVWSTLGHTVHEMPARGSEPYSHYKSRHAHRMMDHTSFIAET